MPAAADLDRPWSRTPPAVAVRELLVCGVLGAAMDLYTRRDVSGAEHFDALDGPVILVANHNSHMDTPLLLRAMPAAVRRRCAVAAAADYFFAKWRNAVSSSLVFATTPLDRSGGGLDDDASRHLDDWLTGGGALLMFAEGTRTGSDAVGRLKSGASVLAARHDVPIVPVFVDGTATAMPTGKKWMRFRHGRPFAQRHDLTIRFNAPVIAGPDDDPRAVMEKVRLALADSGARVEPGSRTPEPPREPVSG